MEEKTVFERVLSVLGALVLSLLGLAIAYGIMVMLFAAVNLELIMH